MRRPAILESRTPPQAATLGVGALLRRITRSGRLLRLSALLVLAAVLGTHLSVTYALFERFEPELLAVDGVLTLLAVIAIFTHIGALTRERRRRATTDGLAAAFTVARNIEETADAGVSMLVAAGVADAGVVAVIRADADEGESTAMVSVALAGYPAVEPGRVVRIVSAGVQPLPPSVAREQAEPDPWLAPLRERLGDRIWVATVPLARDDEMLGVLLLASRRQGPLGDSALLATIGALFATALDHARLYEVAFERARELEEQDGRRREFLYAIAHELRTPLTSIQAFAGLLTEDRRSQDDGTTSRLADSLAHGVDRLGALVDDLLELGRVEDGEVRIEMGTVDVAEPIHAAESMLRAALMDRDQSLSTELPAQQLFVAADARWLEQVLLNLLSNATRHTPKHGSITMRATRMGDIVRVEVDDSGPGIDPIDRTNIFQPFYRVQRNGVEAVPGAGLGLAVAKRFTELQGGRIWVEDAPGGGSRFCVELAVAEPADVPASVEEALPDVR